MGRSVVEDKASKGLVEFFKKWEEVKDEASYKVAKLVQDLHKAASEATLLDRETRDAPYPEDDDGNLDYPDPVYKKESGLGPQETRARDEDPRGKTTRLEGESTWNNQYKPK